MEGMEGALLEAPEVEAVETEQPSEIVETEEGAAPETKADDPYSPKASREYSQWLKNLRDADPNNANFARLSKDNHARLYQLNQIEPKGVDGIRETYALLDSVSHGELKGVEAIGAIQDELRGVHETDEKIAAGDPTALDDLGDEFMPGLAKLLPSIMDRIQAHDSAAFQAAIMPHMVQALAKSPLVGNYNGLVDVLEEQMPSWLPDDKKQAWNQDHMRRVIEKAAGIGNWLNEQAKNAKPQEQKPQTGKQNAVPDERAQFEKERQQHHWETKITPKTNDYAGKRFNELFAPYDKRLKLDGTAKDALGTEFTKRIIAKAVANPVYKSQMARFNAQKNPDPNAVFNIFKVEFDKHAKIAMDALVNERYKNFLNGKPKAAPVDGKPANRGPVAPNVQIVSVKPQSGDIDFKRTPIDWLHQKKYVLKSGKTVQVR